MATDRNLVESPYNTELIWVGTFFRFVTNLEQTRNSAVIRANTCIEGSNPSLHTCTPTCGASSVINPFPVASFHSVIEPVREPLIRVSSA